MRARERRARAPGDVCSFRNPKGQFLEASSWCLECALFGVGQKNLSRALLFASELALRGPELSSSSSLSTRAPPPGLAHARGIRTRLRKGDEPPRPPGRAPSPCTPHEVSMTMTMSQCVYCRTTGPLWLLGRLLGWLRPPRRGWSLVFVDGATRLKLGHGPPPEYI